MTESDILIEDKSIFKNFAQAIPTLSMDQVRTILNSREYRTYVPSGEGWYYHGKYTRDYGDNGVVYTDFKSIYNRNLYIRTYDKVDKMIIFNGDPQHEYIIPKISFEGRCPSEEDFKYICKLLDIKQTNE